MLISADLTSLSTEFIIWVSLLLAVVLVVALLLGMSRIFYNLASHNTTSLMFATNSGGFGGDRLVVLCVVFSINLMYLTEVVVAVSPRGACE